MPELTPAEVAALAIVNAAPRAQLEARIAAISAALKGHGFSFADRLLLNEERHDLRALLAAKP